MKIKGTSLDGEAVEIDTSVNLAACRLVSYPDDDVIYLGGVPCPGSTVEQVGFSDMLAMLKTVTARLEDEIQGVYCNGDGEVNRGMEGCYNRDMQDVWNAQALIAAIEADEVTP